MELAFQHMELVLGAFLAMVLELELDSEVFFPVSFISSIFEKLGEKEQGSRVMQGVGEWMWVWVCYGRER